MIDLRVKHPAFAVGRMETIDLNNVHVFGYRRDHENETVIALTNFADDRQMIESEILKTQVGDRMLTDLLTGEKTSTADAVALEPHTFKWLGV